MVPLGKQQELLQALASDQRLQIMEWLKDPEAGPNHGNGSENASTIAHIPRVREQRSQRYALQALASPRLTRPILLDYEKARFKESGVNNAEDRSVSADTQSRSQRRLRLGGLQRRP